MCWMTLVGSCCQTPASVLVFVNEFVIFSFFTIFLFIFVNENHTGTCWHASSSRAVPHHDMLHFYIAVICPVLEYAVPVWHTGLTADISDQLETVNKGLANAKRPCDCRVLCLRLKSSMCSCAHSISDMTSFGCRDQGRDSVCPVIWMSTWRNSKSAVNGGRIYDSLKPLTDPHHMVSKFLLLGLAAKYRSRRQSTEMRDQHAADHQMLITLPGETSWQCLRRSAVDCYSKNEKLALWATLFGT